MIASSRFRGRRGRDLIRAAHRHQVRGRARITSRRSLRGRLRRSSRVTWRRCRTSQLLGVRRRCSSSGPARGFSTSVRRGAGDRSSRLLPSCVDHAERTGGSTAASVRAKRQAGNRATARMLDAAIAATPTAGGRAGGALCYTAVAGDLGARSELPARPACGQRSTRPPQEAIVWRFG